MAARRDGYFSNNINAVDRPTAANADIDSKRKFPSASNRKSDGILSKNIKPGHKRLSRMLGVTLLLDTVEAWAGFRFVTMVRMSEGQRAMLAYFALTSLAPENAERTAAEALGAVGNPLPAFLNGMDEARFWARCATRNELRAYADAAFEAMTPGDQAAFARRVINKEVVI